MNLASTQTNQKRQQNNKYERRNDSRKTISKQQHTQKLESKANSNKPQQPKQFQWGLQPFQQKEPHNQPPLGPQRNHSSN